MTQQSEESKKRLAIICDRITMEALDQFKNEQGQAGSSEVVVYGVAKEAYIRGMQDPEANSERIKHLEGLLGECEEFIKKLVESCLFSAKETDRISREIFPETESCGCEAPCDCSYPLGYIDLSTHKYHCYGTEIMADEFLQKLKAAKEGRS